MTSTLNLSLLARGVGEVKRNGSEKIDVILEPNDYYNFTQTRLYLPPIHSQPNAALYENKNLHLPKTFITRKGALLLFSEDFAQKARDQEGVTHYKKHRVTSAFEELDIHTVEDLANSILSYGSAGGKGEVNLHFVKQGQTQRLVRPGFSARRYLSKLTRSFDETFLKNLMNKGYVSEKSLFQTNVLLPNLKKRINDDLSHMPAPYRIMKQMLLAPGMLSGFSFYRQQTDGSRSDLSTLNEDADADHEQRHGELKIVEIKDGEMRSVEYGDLPDEQKKNVLADLLVKSAISHALEKQKQVIQSRNQSVEDDDDNMLVVSGRASLKSDNKEVQQFDMAEAVRSYIQSQVSDHVQDEITEAIRSKKTKLSTRKQVEAAWQLEAASARKHKQVGADTDRQTAQHDSTEYEDDFSSTTPVLPPIIHGKGLIEVPYGKDAEVGEDGIPLLHIEPPTPQNTLLDEKQKRVKKRTTGRKIADGYEKVEEDFDQEQFPKESARKEKHRKVKNLKTGREAVSSQQVIESPTSSVASKGVYLSPSSVFENGSESTRSEHMTADGPILPPPMPSFRGKALRAGGVSKVKDRSTRHVFEDVNKQKGSVVVLPGGDIVKVGGTVSGSGGEQVSYTARTADEYTTTDYDSERDDWPSKRHRSSKTYQQDRGSVITDSDEYSGDAHKDRYDSGSTPPEISEEELVQHLSDQAHRIAAAILSRPGTGFSLTEDAQRVEELQSGKLSVAEEYKTLLKDTINSALLKSQGDDANLVPEDADIDEEVLRAIAQQDELGPDDLEVTENEEGRQVVRIRSSRKEAIREAKEQKRIESYKDSSQKTTSVTSVMESQYYDYSDSPSRTGYSETEPSQSESTRSRSKSQSQWAPGSSHSAATPVSRPAPELTSSKTERKSEVTSTTSFSEGQSQKRERTQSRSKSSGTKEDTKEEFVVRTVHDNSELQRLYGPVDTPPPRTKESKKPRVPPAKSPKKTKKKAKAEKKKVEKKPVQSDKDDSSTHDVSQKSAKTVSETSVSLGMSETESIKTTEQEEEMEFIIIRDEFSDSEPEEEEPKVKSVASSKLKSTAVPSSEDYSDVDSVHTLKQTTPAPDGSLHTVSSREARAAERAARANKKREEVERKRREREEQMKRQKEAMDERERLQRELEEERRRKEEERRMQREREEEERRRQEQEELDRERRRRLEVERERKMREEYARKLEQMKRQKLEEDRKRKELAEQRQREEEERRRQEEEMLAAMNENERMEYLRKKAEEEERRRIELEERRKQEAEEMAKLEAEARYLAEQMAMKQAEMERRLQFNRSLHLEAHGLEHTLNITEAFTWSYFELLQWLGLDLPDFERMKSNRF